MSDLSPELRRLLDRQDIVDCLHRYTRGLDRHDNDLLLSVFHEDAIDHHGDFCGHPKDFISWSGELHQPWKIHTHFIDSNYIDIDGDVAHAETYVLFVHSRKEGDRLDLGGGRYIDRFERRNGEWKIAARRMLLEWSAKADPAQFADTAAYKSGTWDKSDPSYARPFTIQTGT